MRDERSRHLRRLRRLHASARRWTVLAGGFGSAVLESLAQGGFSIPVLRLGVPDTLVPHGTRNQLLEQLGLTPGGIARSVSAWIADTAPVVP